MNDEAAALHADPERAFDGQYQLGAEIGAGELGVVYRGVDERLDKPVAIKVWHARLGDVTPLREQYDAEARALTALEHPNLVAVRDYGIAGQAPYLIMELLEGQTLEARMRASALPPSLTQTFMESVLRGLGYMHMRGVVHRNLNADNVFLHDAEDGTQTLKLLDLGMECLPANGNAAGAATMSLAQRSAYDSPEQEAGSEPDGRSDVYAAGVLMTHMLSGREPEHAALRAAADSADGLFRLLPNATPEARAFIARAVATERSARFGNADQMLRALLELPTPWSSESEDLAAPTSLPPMSVASVRPASEPAHADFDGSATSAFHEDMSQPPPAAISEAEIEVGPIGLMARLRVRRRLLLIILAGLVLVSAAAGASIWLGHSALDRAATRGVEAPAAKPKTAETHEQAAEDEADQAEAEEPEAGGTSAQTPQTKTAEPAPAVAAAPEATRFSARLGDEGETKPPTSDKLILPTAEPAEPAVQHAQGEAPAAQLEAQHATPAKQAAGQADRPASSAPHAAAPANAEPESANAQPEHAAGSAPAPAAAEGVNAAPQAAAEPEKPKPPTPQEIGSERHMEPDRTEIRQMLALAVAHKPHLAAKNPWNIAMPDSLQALRDAIANGGRGSPGNLKTLRRYNSANPDDVYGHLLLAGFYANRGYSLDALDQYDMAYRIDSSSRGAPEMLKHPLNMVLQGIAETDAVRFIDRVFGREAQAAIAQLLRSRDTSAAAARRLKQLQARISSGKRR